MNITRLVRGGLLLACAVTALAWPEPAHAQRLRAAVRRLIGPRVPAVVVIPPAPRGVLAPYPYDDPSGRSVIVRRRIPLVPNRTRPLPGGTERQTVRRPVPEETLDERYVGELPPPSNGADSQTRFPAEADELDRSSADDDVRVPPEPGTLARAEAEIREARYGEALETLRGLIETDPDNARAVLLASHALFGIGAYPEAAATLRAALEGLPEEEWGQTVSNYRDYFASPVEYADALRDLSQYVAENPRRSDGRLLLGYHYGFLGLRADAAAELETAAALDKQDSLAGELLARFRPEPLLRRLPDPPGPAQESAGEPQLAAPAPAESHSASGDGVSPAGPQNETPAFTLPVPPDFPDPPDEATDAEDAESAPATAEGPRLVAPTSDSQDD